MTRGKHPAVVITASLVVTVVVFLALELGVRVAGIEPAPWPSADMPFQLPQVEVSPLLGPLPRPGWSGDWFGDFEVQIDEHGFRSTGRPPAPSVRRSVVFMGDSCSFGWGVDTPETYVAQLDDLQRRAGQERFALLNAAYPGHSATVGLYMLRERVLPLKPDVVVLGYSANNAFRFSLVSDAQRFRSFSLRKLMLRSRLLHILAAKLAGRMTTHVHPRNRKAISEVPFKDLQRVAASDEFEGALRAMVGEARKTGAKVVFLLFPRASGVSTQFTYEDAAFRAQHGQVPEARKDGRVSPSAIGLFEVSCLDQRLLDDPIDELYRQMKTWQPVYPSSADVRSILQQGAAAYVRDDLEEASRRFVEAVGLAPTSPLAHYDLGVSRLAGGDAAGLADLTEADRLACNVFLHYQVLIWRVANELGVPVVDLTLRFQTHDGEELFLDPAHPNATGHALIAEALWSALAQVTPAS